MRVIRALRSLHAPILVTDPASAEMIKYASNAFLATKISFINAIANLCEAVDADVREVALGMGYDQRIGFEFLHPGPGYGGSCFPKDTAALLYAAADSGYDFSLLEGVVEVNCASTSGWSRRCAPLAGGALDGVPVAVWGLTFKAEHRRPPRLARARHRPPAARGGRDGPGVRPGGRRAGRASWCPGSRSCPTRTRRATAPTCSPCSPSGTSSAGSTSTASPTLLRRPAVLDARNLLDPAALRRRGFTYEGVGR